MPSLRPGAPRVEEVGGVDEREIAGSLFMRSRSSQLVRAAYQLYPLCPHGVQSLHNSDAE
jgi:hypothetical protein